MCVDSGIDMDVWLCQGDGHLKRVVLLGSNTRPMEAKWALRISNSKRKHRTGNLGSWYVELTIPFGDQVCSSSF